MKRLYAYINQVAKENDLDPRILKMVWRYQFRFVKEKIAMMDQKPVLLAGFGSFVLKVDIYKKLKNPKLRDEMLAGIQKRQSAYLKKKEKKLNEKQNKDATV